MTTMIQPTTPEGFGGRELRRTPRVDVDDYVAVEVVGHAITANLREAGLGGCQIVTSWPLPIGTETALRLDLDGLESTLFLGRVAHCNRWTQGEGQLTFLVGVDFGSQSDRQAAAVESLVTRLMQRQAVEAC